MYPAPASLTSYFAFQQTCFTGFVLALSISISRSFCFGSFCLFLSFFLSCFLSQPVVSFLNWGLFCYFQVLLSLPRFDLQSWREGFFFYLLLVQHILVPLIVSYCIISNPPLAPSFDLFFPLSCSINDSSSSSSLCFFGTYCNWFAPHLSSAGALASPTVLSVDWIRCSSAGNEKKNSRYGEGWERRRSVRSCHGFQFSVLYYCIRSRRRCRDSSKSG